MFNPVLRVLIIAVMLVGFVGQAIAFNTSMPCETSAVPLSPSINNLIKRDDSNSLKIDSAEDCCGIECCDLNCNCIANGCSSFIYLSTEIDSTEIASFSEAGYMQQFEQPKSIASLRYRPPIFTS